MAVCWSCSSAVGDGVRWCPMCYASLVDPTAGRLSSPGKRLGAFALDSLIFMVFAVVVIGAAVAVVRANGGVEAAEAIVEAANAPAGATAPTIPDETSHGFAVAGIIVALGIVGFLVLNLIFYSQGTTPGKKMLGMRVIKEDGTTAGLGTMLLREWIGKFISHLVMSLGFIWILIDTNRQGWHDKLVSTYVVE